MDLYTISIITFIVALAVLLFKDRNKIEVSNYVLFIRRTERGRGLISKIANKNKKFWSYLGNISTAVGFLGMGIAFYYIAKMFLDQIMGVPSAGGPRLVIPVPSQEAAFLPGVLGVPFWPWIISIGLLMVVHEGMHGIMVKTIDSKIRSLGVLLLAVIPGAFVEPDEEDLKEKSWVDQLKVYSAGSFANFCLGVVVILVVTFAFIPVFMTSAVSFQGYVDSSEYNTTDFPAERANLTGSIISIDGQRVENLEDLSEILDRRSPGENIELVTTEGRYDLELSENPNSPGESFLGIARVGNTQIVEDRYRGTSASSGIEFMFELLNWIFILNVGIGLMNLLPLKPLDGGLMLEAVSQRFFPDRSKEIVRLFSSLSFALLIGIFLIIFLG